MSRESLVKIVRKWAFAGCVLALILSGIAPRSAMSQEASTTQAESPKKSSIPAAKISKRSSTKAHSASTGTKSTAASHKGHGKLSSRKSGKSKKVARGQQRIDPERAQAIQEALLREHYLRGDAAGTWNQASEDAMRRYQSDHGWQSKTVPDSRALISLGLGPSHDHLLNPESAMTTSAEPSSSPALTPVSHSTDPGARLSTNSTSTTRSLPADSAPTPSGRDSSGPQ